MQKYHVSSFFGGAKKGEKRCAEIKISATFNREIGIGVVFFNVFFFNFNRLPLHQLNSILTQLQKLLKMGLYTLLGLGMYMPLEKLQKEILDNLDQVIF